MIRGKATSPEAPWGMGLRSRNTEIAGLAAKAAC